MTMESRETHAARVWLQNDQALYFSARRAARKHREDDTEGLAEELAAMVAARPEVADGVGNLENVDWASLAESFYEEID